MTFMKSILDQGSPATDQIFKTSMALSTEPPSSSISSAIIEPLPQINYFLLNHLIAIARPHLTKSQLKRMDYLVDARRGFYQGHAKFQAAYRDLLDAYACAETLDKRHDELTKQLADTLATKENNNNNNKSNHQTTAAMIRNHITALQIQRQSNNEDMRVRLETLNDRTKSRQHVAAWFSELKVVFLRDEMPWLVALTKQCYQLAMSRSQQSQSQQQAAAAAAGASSVPTPMHPSPHDVRGGLMMMMEETVGGSLGGGGDDDEEDEDSSGGAGYDDDGEGMEMRVLSEGEGEGVEDMF